MNVSIIKYGNVPNKSITDNFVHVIFIIIIHTVRYGTVYWTAVNGQTIGMILFKEILFNLCLHTTQSLLSIEKQVLVLNIFMAIGYMYANS